MPRKEFAVQKGSPHASRWRSVSPRYLSTPEPQTEDPDLRTWFTAYSGGGAGSVTTKAFPEPYIGPLAPENGEPRIVALGLNPGPADLAFQGRGGIFEREIRDSGSFGKWAVTEPYLRRPWSDRHSRNPYHENLRTFARRWLNDDSLHSRDVLVFELFPWHSNRVTAAMRPDTRLIERYIWNPLAELSVPVVFAFGSHWVEAALALGLTAQEVEVSFATSHRWLRVFKLPSGQRLAVVWQAGYSGPPGPTDTETLRRALREPQSRLGAVTPLPTADLLRMPTVLRPPALNPSAVIAVGSSKSTSMRVMTVNDLMTAVNELRSADAPIVLARPIKDWCRDNQIDGGADNHGYTWNHLDQASKAAQRMGQLRKWKNTSSRLVGWSPKDATALAEAKAWASDHGWTEKWD